MADTKVSALTSATPVATDVLYLVDDPGGTPLSKKATVQGILDLVTADAWGDAVDADIVPTGADSTYDLGATAARFAEAYTDTLYLTDGTVTSDVADGATADGFVLNTSNAFSTSGANLVSVQNNSVEKFAVDKDGILNLRVGMKILLSDTTDGTYIRRGPSDQNIEVANSGIVNAVIGSSIFSGGPAGTAGIEIGSSGKDAYLTTPFAVDSDLYVVPGNRGNSSKDGKDLYLVGGAASTSGNWTGGDIYLDGGIKNGTGADGAIYIANTRGLLSCFAATPVAQQSGTGETTGFTAGTGTGVNDDSTFTGNVGSTAYRISDVVKALKNYGLLAS